MFDADSDDDDCRLMEVWWQQQEEEVEKASAEVDAASRMAKAPIDFIMVDLRCSALCLQVSCWRSKSSENPWCEI